MIADPAQVIRHHLANQIAPDYALRRRVCDCGKKSTVKQLGQYGCCVTCEKTRQAVK